MKPVVKREESDRLASESRTSASLLTLSNGVVVKSGLSIKGQRRSNQGASSSLSLQRQQRISDGSVSIQRPSLAGRENESVSFQRRHVGGLGGDVAASLQPITVEIEPTRPGFGAAKPSPASHSTVGTSIACDTGY